MIDIIGCPYCDKYSLRQPMTDKERNEFQRLMIEHCKEEHMDDIIWEIIQIKTQ